MHRRTPSVGCFFFVLPIVFHPPDASNRALQHDTATFIYDKGARTITVSVQSQEFLDRGITRVFFNLKEQLTPMQTRSLSLSSSFVLPSFFLFTTKN